MVSRLMKKDRTRQLKLKLKTLWKKEIGSNPPEGVNTLARGLCEKLNIQIIPGKKMAYSVLEITSGIPPICERIDTKKKKAKKYVSRRHASPTKDAKAVFYASWDWRTLRMQVLKEFGATCMCCGATPQHKDMAGNPIKIVVDHIKPLHHHWGLRLQRSNLQILCEECNMGKGAWDETDHRPKDSPDEWIIEDEPSELIAAQLKIRH